MKTGPRTGFALAVACALSLMACRRDKAGPKTPVSDESSRTALVRAPNTMEAPYPQGRWRLASNPELDRVVLWASHILIRHNDAETTQAPLTLSPWRLLDPPPARTRDEALQIARRLEREARLRPGDFERLVEEMSEDPVTKPFGGKLGAVTAFYLRGWPALLDALAVLEVGATSAVIETEHGFHIVRRDPPPTPESLTGRRLVIGYIDAPTLVYRQRPDKRLVRRTRDEAERLARGLADRLRKSPGAFDEAVREHSELSDAARHGDLGVWSSSEPTPLPRELLALRAMPVGGVSNPLDSYLGFQVLIRDAVTERPTYAAAMIQLSFEPSAPTQDERSRKNAEERAESILQELRRDPGQFANFQRTLCCKKPERWSLGRDPVGLAAALEPIGIGQIVPSVIVSENRLVIAKRLDPDAVPPQDPPILELPAPLGPQLDRLVQTADPRTLGRFCRQLPPVASPKLGLTGDVLTQFESLHEEMATKFEKAQRSEDKVALMETAFERLQRLLGSAKYSEYRAVLHAYVESRIYGLKQEPR